MSLVNEISGDLNKLIDAESIFRYNGWSAMVVVHWKIFGPFIPILLKEGISYRPLFLR